VEPATKLLWVVERFPPDRGGLAVAAARQAQALAPCLDRLDVVRLTAGLPPGAADGERCGDVHVLHIGQAPTRSESLQLLERAARNLVERWDHAILHGIGAAGSVATTVARLTGRRAVVGLRGNDVERAQYDARFAQVLWTLTHADAVLAVTRDLVARVRALTGRVAGVTYVPNGVDGDVFRPDVAPSDDLANLRTAPRPWIAAVGETRLKKGLPVLTALAATLARKGRGTLFLIGGVRADERGGFARWRLTEPAASARVREIPYLTDEKLLAALYAAMDVVVFPSLWDGMPNALLEAMACARPVVASAVGGAIDVIEPGVSGVLVAPSRLDEFAATTLAVADGAYGEPRALGAAARARVLRDFTVPAERDRILAVYRSLGA
jgi:glycosyltransferase involved in cell wall biosynthesis